MGDKCPDCGGPYYEYHVPRSGGVVWHNCPACEKKELQAKVQALRERVAVAGGLIARFSAWSLVLYLCQPLPGMDFPEPLTKIYDDAKAFLTNVPGQEMVMVRRDYAEQILDALEEGTIESINMKAALAVLGGKEKRNVTLG